MVVVILALCNKLGMGRVSQPTTLPSLMICSDQNPSDGLLSLPEKNIYALISLMRRKHTILRPDFGTSCKQYVCECVSVCVCERERERGEREREDDRKRMKERGRKN